MVFARINGQQILIGRTEINKSQGEGHTYRRPQQEPELIEIL